MIRHDWELQVSVDQVLRGQGADPEAVRRRRPALVEAAEWALGAGQPLLRPAVLLEELVVEELRHEWLSLAGGGRLQGALIGQHMGGAERVAVLVCTLGGLLEKAVSEWMERDPLRGLALNGFGAAALEVLSAEVCLELEGKAAAEGLKTSVPLSPGMIGWPVEKGQRQIFALLPAQEIGVSLTSACMMKPRFSITQVVGIGKEISASGRSCDYCSLKETCKYQSHYAPV